MAEQTVGDVGQYATRPLEVPKRGWWQVVRRVKREIAADNLSVVAAGVAFYGFLAVFPMIGAVMTIFGLIADPALAAQQMQPFQHFVPSEVFDILMEQVNAVTSKADATLSFGLFFGLALTLWSSTKGIKALFVALNVAYEETEQRSFIRLNVAVLIFTLCAVVFMAFSLGIIAVIPIAVQLVSADPTLEKILLLVRWPIIAALIIVALALFYRYAPNRRNAEIKWITPGAILATVLWLVMSVAFSLYVRNFGNYDETFGALGAVVVLLFWFYFSAFAVCIGAELNAELEMQTHHDSTVGPARPEGERGAYVADHTAH